MAEGLVAARSGHDGVIGVRFAAIVGRICRGERRNTQSDVDVRRQWKEVFGIDGAVVLLDAVPAAKNARFAVRVEA